MSTFLGIDIDIYEIGQDTQIADQVWKHTYRLAT